MKRKVLCIFSLLAYLLLFCTALAPMVQREMAVLAVVKQVKGSTKYNTIISISALQWGDEESLFQIVEGTGWNTGSRVDIIPRQYYVASGDVTLHPGTEYTVILSASKTPQVGDLVESVETKESPGEKLILYSPEGIFFTKALQNNFTVAQEGEKGVLLDSIRLNMPFFEHQMMHSLGHRIATQELRIYSYTDAETFLQQLPLLATMGGLLLAAVILWGGTCILTKKQRPKWLLWINTGAMSLTLLLLLFLTKAVDLPSSLMPPDNILNIKHYFSEFSNIFTAMTSMGNQSLQNLCQQMTATSIGILLAAAILSIVLLWLESKWCARAHSKASGIAKM